MHVVVLPPRASERPTGTASSMEASPSPGSIACSAVAAGANSAAEGVDVLSNIALGVIAGLALPVGLGCMIIEMCFIILDRKAGKR